MKKATVKSLMLDKVNNAPVVLLSIEDENRVIPIWIGISEANLIALKLEGMTFPRPLTHDLIINILNALSYKIERLTIHSIVNNTFMASIWIKDVSETEDDNLIEIDARPSDCIILSISNNIPLYISNEIIEKHSIVIETSDKEDETFKNFVDNMDLETFRRFFNESGDKNSEA